MTRRKRKKGIRIGRLLLLLIVITGIIYIAKEAVFYSKDFKNFFFNNEKSEENPKSNDKDKDNDKELQNNYEACLNEPYSEDEINYKLQAKIEEIDNLIANNYKASVYFEDLKLGFTYTYKPEEVYYGCSLIKLVDAIYLINKATVSDNKIDLDKVTIKYDSKYVMAYSDGLKRHKIGDDISLRNLIKYAISVSDNSAHMMLINYIGFNNLKEYGKSLGGKVILTGGDNFGNQTAEDTNNYLKEAYRIITKNEEYGQFLKEIMDNDERNAFNTDDIRIYHKYGSYGDNFHDIGLSLEEHPYAISILTLHEKSNYTEVIQTIHTKIRELRDLFYENRENNCYNIIYNKNN